MFWHGCIQLVVVSKFPANIIPVPKGRCSEVVDSFRPVSILPIVMKVSNDLQEHAILHPA